MIDRRGFLTGTGLLARLLPLSGASAAAEPTPVPTEVVPATETFGRATSVDSVGSAEVHTRGSDEMTVGVTSHPEGTTLKLSSDAMTSRVLLTPSQVAELTAALEAALRRC